MKIGAGLVLLGGGAAKTVRGFIPRGAVVVQTGRVPWAGPQADLAADYDGWPHEDLGGRLLTPAFIDCYTHIIHGGHRAREFEMRLQAASYEDVARAGGGIISTVTATRAASEDDLIAQALPRLDALIAEGVSCVEVKSGYGIDMETELRMLRAARRLGQLRPVRIRTTFFGAHAVPPDYENRPDAYIDEVCIPALRAAHAEKLIDAVDGFCEGIAFTIMRIAHVLDVVCELGLPVKLHAEQLSHMGGTALVARYGALSVDHVENATEADAQFLAASGPVAVLLPGAIYAIRETQMLPVANFRTHNVPMALATDSNPGSSPLTSLLLATNMGCILFRLTPDEALLGVTCHAARALGLHDTGTIAVGMRADLAIWNVETPAERAYRFGFNPLHQRIFGSA